jgi:hypothetical protein
MTGSSGHSPAAEIVPDILVVCPQERDLRMIEAAGLDASFRVHVVGEDPDLPGFEPGLVLEQAMAVPADGVVGTKDRSALLAAVIARRRGLPGPTVEALFACQHKPTSRRLQQQVVPDATPRFELVSGPALPFRPPLFVKPVVGRLSQSARRVDSVDDLPEPGENDEYAAGYRAVAELAGVADGFERFLAEELLEGAEVTLEGYVHRGRVTVIGVTDSLKYAGTNSFEGFVYPSSLPRPCLEEIEGVASRLLPALGFDDGFFNVEFFVPQSGPAKVIEVNGRIASQFAPLVQALHGRSTYDALFALACGDDPAWSRDEPAGVSLSYVMRRFEDAFVEDVPEPQPNIEVLVRPGALLSEQHATNDPASFRLAILYQTGVDREAALARARERAAALTFRLRPVRPR